MRTRDAGAIPVSTRDLDLTGECPNCCSPRTRPTLNGLFHSAECEPIRERRISRVRRRRARAKRSIPESKGTKAAAHYAFEIPAGGRTITLNMRLCAEDEAPSQAFGPEFERIFAERIRRGGRVLRGRAFPIRPIGGRLPRQPPGLRGLLWSKQFYHYVVKDWLDGDPDMPPPPESRKHGRNSRLAPSVQSRRDLHARQMGVSLVCRVGPGLSHDSLCPAGPRIRQGATRAVAARMVHASQRTDAGL